MSTSHVKGTFHLGTDKLCHLDYLGQSTIMFWAGKRWLHPVRVTALAVTSRLVKSPHCYKGADRWILVYCILALGPGPLTNTNVAGNPSSTVSGLRCCGLMHLTQTWEALWKACKVQQLAAKAGEIKISSQSLILGPRNPLITSVTQTQIYHS